MEKQTKKYNKIRFLKHGDMTQLMRECNCSHGSIYNALLGKSNTPLCEMIREKAKKYPIYYY
jgi:spore coat polysaccharide biosynthesis predicted glycosyltransferase SpsG